MSASRKSIDDVVATLENWRGLRDISPVAVLELLERLARVKGNQSFRATTAMLLAAYRKELNYEIRLSPGVAAARGAAVRTDRSNTG